MDKQETMRVLFKAKLVSSDEFVIGTYHYSNDGKYHYILNRECFLKRTYDSGNEMSLKEQEVHLVDGNTVIQINDDAIKDATMNRAKELQQLIEEEKIIDKNVELFNKMRNEK